MYSKLDETTRSVYKENVRVNEALGYHIKESEELKALEERLAKENKQLKEGKELNEVLVKDKVVENKRQKSQIKEVNKTLIKITNLKKKQKKHCLNMVACQSLSKDLKIEIEDLYHL